jgi:coenzyme F420 hydrogenase subunit beta
MQVVNSATGFDKGAKPVTDSVLSLVVPNGLCVGCGMCAALLPESLHMVVDRYGAYVPGLVDSEARVGWEQKSLAVCPFGGREENEDTIAAELFAHQERIQHRSETGYFLECFAGYVADEAYRLASTSGGLITWLIGSLLKSGWVDAAVCVGPSDTPDKLFDYRIIKYPAELQCCKKSRYYPVEVSDVIPRIKALEDKVVFVGLPCFLKALRYAMMEDTVLRERVVCTIGLFCGHLKTRHYAAYLCRCCGANENDVITVDFRKKVRGTQAGLYAFEATVLENGKQKTHQILMRDVFAGSWSFNLFMLGACDWCDDVLAETADIAIGDAWLREYNRDWRGTNLVICRSQAMLERLRCGVNSGELHLESVPIEKVIKSAEPTLRHRRGGLAYRLYLNKKKGEWRPRKRVVPQRCALPLFNRIIQRIRMQTRNLSHDAFLRQQKYEGIEVFVRALRPWVRLHYMLYALRGWLFRLARKVLRWRRST